MALPNLKTQIASAMKKVTGQIEASLSSSVMRQIGEFACMIIARRTRLGYGVAAMGEKKERLASLDPDYIKLRRELKSAGRAQMSPLTTVGKSNLTLTGQLLDSLKVIKYAAGRCLIGPEGSRRSVTFDRFSKKTGKKLKSKEQSEFWTKVRDKKFGEREPTNAEVGAYVSKKRPFLQLSDLELVQVRRFWRKMFGDLKGRFR